MPKLNPMQIMRITKPDPDRVLPIDVLEKVIMPLAVSLMRETMDKPKSERLLVIRFDAQSKMVEVRCAHPESTELLVNLSTGESEDAQPQPIRTSDNDFVLSRRHAIREIRDSYLQFRQTLEENTVWSSSLEFSIKRGIVRGARFRSDRQVPLPSGLDRASNL